VKIKDFWNMIENTKTTLIKLSNVQNNPYPKIMFLTKIFKNEFSQKIESG
jgi:hypothetical protein